MTQQDLRAAPYLSAFSAFERDGGASGPGWLHQLRQTAMADFQRLGFPTTRRGNEPWKYTDVRKLASASFTMPPAPDPIAASEIDLTPYELPCPRVHLLVFVDGHYTPSLSTEPQGAGMLHSDVIARHGDGPIVGLLSEAAERGVPAVREHLGRHAALGASAFTALNTAFLRDGAFVSIPDDTAVAEPIYLLFIVTGAAGATVTYPRVLIVMGQNSKATVLQSFESAADASYFNNAVTEVVVGPGAHLRLYRLQREGPSAYHVATTQVVQARDSRVSSVTLDLGAGLMRHDLSVRLEEPGASVSLGGLYLGDDKRHVDNHTFVDHAVPDTSSTEVYKGILDDESHGVFVGQVLVQRDAQRTDTHQVNKNLLLSDGAEIDSQPKLEIFADDVKCTHGAAVGQLDQSVLFYLKSRGIGETAARLLLVHGFVSEVIESIADEAVRQYADAAVVAAMGEA